MVFYKIAFRLFYFNSILFISPHSEPYSPHPSIPTQITGIPTHFPYIPTHSLHSPHSIPQFPIPGQKHDVQTPHCKAIRIFFSPNRFCSLRTKQKEQDRQSFDIYQKESFLQNSKRLLNLLNIKKYFPWKLQLNIPSIYF